MNSNNNGYSKSGIRGDSRDTITINDDGYFMMASPNASYGYMHITAGPEQGIRY